MTCRQFVQRAVEVGMAADYRSCETCFRQRQEEAGRGGWRAGHNPPEGATQKS